MNIQTIRVVKVSELFAGINYPTLPETIMCKGRMALISQSHFLSDADTMMNEVTPEEKETVDMIAEMECIERIRDLPSDVWIDVDN